jgi:hypothetical protein
MEEGQVSQKVSILVRFKWHTGECTRLPSRTRSPTRCTRMKPPAPATTTRSSSMNPCPLRHCQRRWARVLSTRMKPPAPATTTRSSSMNPCPLRHCQRRWARVQDARPLRTRPTGRLEGRPAPSGYRPLIPGLGRAPEAPVQHPSPSSATMGTAAQASIHGRTCERCSWGLSLGGTRISSIFARSDSFDRERRRARPALPGISRSAPESIQPRQRICRPRRTVLFSSPGCIVQARRGLAKCCAQTVSS